MMICVCMLQQVTRNASLRSLLQQQAKLKVAAQSPVAKIIS